MNELAVPLPQETDRVIDITGPENTLLLLAAPGDEVSACGGLIAEACARGRPPFIVILGDGAPDGSAERARARERAARAACRELGLPDDRLLFVGLRQGAFPAAGTPLFRALRVAITEVSWRRDCNVVLAPLATAPEGDAAATWQLACALSRDIAAPLLAACGAAAPPPDMRASWRLDVRRWSARIVAAGRAHGDRRGDAGYEVYGRIA
jgi:LmbE family N-acetylglucosaminyl deacetylase